LVAGAGADRLVGGNGYDVLRAADGLPNDYLIGGPGVDRCIIDQGDVTQYCEQIRVR
jgi:Ca2+-binding RTX toxin-like protein